MIMAKFQMLILVKDIKLYYNYKSLKKKKNLLHPFCKVGRREEPLKEIALADEKNSDVAGDITNCFKMGNRPEYTRF